MCPKTNRFPPTVNAMSVPMALVLVMSLATPCWAQGTQNIRTRDEFLALVEGARLSTLGMVMRIRGDGSITGRAFGTPLRGTWDWSDTYFCSALRFGGRNHARNCQTVMVISHTLRMTEDEGRGLFTDFWLRR
ncbi:MAG: dihydrodipicolinate reductase [Rhodobacteraceae bacterium]|nr:dihydrodipicolinate reductase [Paracoccaceae bacterium]MBR9821502.1 dihydrodipicolinate reductase [Paracoccaceae bacterium]